MAKATSILGISISTRAIGIVILKNDTVLEWRIKSYKESWSTQKLQMILHEIEACICDFRVSYVAIKIPTKITTTSKLSLLLDALKDLIKKGSLQTSSYTLAALKQSFPGLVIRNKKQMMYQLALQFPYILPWYKKELMNHNPYHVKIFEALLAAIHYQDEVCR